MNYEKIKDRYKEPLKEPAERPTIEQSVYAWALLNELLKIGYPHSFQRERSDLRDFCYDVSALIDKAYEIKELKKSDGK